MNRNSESHTGTSAGESDRRNAERRQESRREHKRVRIVEDTSERRQEERRGDDEDR